MSLSQKINKLIGRYKSDPIGWIKDNIDFDGLECDGLTWQQEEICTNLVKYKKICVSAGTGIGKSALLAMLIQWFLITHPGSRIPCTAPTAKQLYDVLFSEVDKWLSRNKLKDFYNTLRGKIHIVGYPNWYAVARTVPKDKRAINGTLAGFHSGSIMIIVDEAADVPDGVFTALDGAMTTKDCYIVLISNPVSTGGYYYDTISDPKGKGAGFKVLYYSSADSPLVSKAYIDQIVARYGEDSSMYRAKVLGQPLKFSDNIVVDPKVYDEVVTTQKEMCTGQVVLGVDVGGGGQDPTVVCHRVGNSIVRWDNSSESDPQKLGDWIDGLCYNLYVGKDLTVVVDALGVGSGLFHNLDDRPRFYKVIGHIGSEKGSDPEMYLNKRSEVYYRLHKHFRNLHFPVQPPSRLKKELCNLFFNLHSGPISMEPKEKFHSRLHFSPDNADALSMTEIVNIESKRVPIVLRPKVINVLSRLCEVPKEQKYGRYSVFL